MVLERAEPHGLSRAVSRGQGGGGTSVPSLSLPSLQSSLCGIGEPELAPRTRRPRPPSDRGYATECGNLQSRELRG